MSFDTIQSLQTDNSEVSQTEMNLVQNLFKPPKDQLVRWKSLIIGAILIFLFIVLLKVKLSTNVKIVIYSSIVGLGSLVL